MDRWQTRALRNPPRRVPHPNVAPFATLEPALSVVERGGDFDFLSTAANSRQAELDGAPLRNFKAHLAVSGVPRARDRHH